jgi:hypothetical protein
VSAEQSSIVFYGAGLVGKSVTVGYHNTVAATFIVLNSSFTMLTILQLIRSQKCQLTRRMYVPCNANRTGVLPDESTPIRNVNQPALPVQYFLSHIWSRLESWQIVDQKS